MNIAYMRKVTLSLSAGEEGKRTEAGLDPKQFDFIFGIGSDGLTPLERILEGRQEKDELLLETKGNDSVHIFQHLWFPEVDALFRQASSFLKITVLSVSEADPRDVIRALAETARCGDDCCGGH
jgi:hypothetical protein